jgi:hypothetical protein
MTKFRSSHYGWIRKTLKPDKKNGGTLMVPPFFFVWSGSAALFLSGQAILQHL